MPRLLFVVIGVVAASAATATRQQDAPPFGVTGTWDVTADGAIRRNADGTVDVLNTRSFTLELHEKDGAVSGTMVFREDRRPLAGTWADGRLAVATAWEDLPGTRRDEPITLRGRWVFSGSRQGETLGGTYYLEIEGRDPAPLKWTAQRGGAHAMEGWA
jgi:hypothetical protein